ncbi:LADA_0D11100g1_1 [Lachancea dasiensis]|uniref:LADA_0D11100g1_1 n=1 Tax=Lachancea dasiensis TaxID=1072105 RepID=A0A1G4J7Y1_9SACH|nr:LADA_0D11100g1_1 [Lachancea dasiensis]
MNKTISRCLDVIAADHITLKQLLRRILAIYGIVGAATLPKLKRHNALNGHTRLQLLLRNAKIASLVCCLVNIHPLLYKLLRTRWLSFNALIVAATKLQIPPWISTYILFESLVDRIYSSDVIRGITPHFSNGTWNTLRQALLSLLIPLLRDTRPSRAKTIIFERKSLWKNFGSLFLLWNVISVYQFSKSLLYRRKGQEKRQNGDKRSSQGFYTLKDNLKEINELSTSRSVREKIISCSLRQNLPTTIKWALWRQLLWSILGPNHTLRSHLHISTVLMIGFYVLDNGTNQMYIRAGVLKYLVRLLITDRLLGNPHWQTVALWLGSNLALRNYTRERRLITS